MTMPDSSKEPWSRLIAAKTADNRGDKTQKPTVVDGDYNLKKRRKQLVKVACESCKARRRRCDGQRPKCEACKQKNIPCNYEVAYDQTRSAAQKQLIKKLQADKGSLLELIWWLQTTTVDQGQAFLDHIRSRSPVDGLSVDLLRDIGFDIKAEISKHTDELEPSLGASTGTNTSGYVPDGSADIAAKASIGVASAHAASAEAGIVAPTVNDVKQAIEAFHDSAGVLFYIFDRSQTAAIVEKELGGIQRPGLSTFVEVLNEPFDLDRNARLAELCGVAAVGMLYLRTSDQPLLSREASARWLYNIAKIMLDSAIQKDTLTAMRVCALLAIYNNIRKSVVALAYVKVGLSLAQTHQPHGQFRLPSVRGTMPVEHKRILRTLLILYGWLSFSLGYTSEQPLLATDLDMMDGDILEEEVIQREITKITVMKADMIRATTGAAAISDRIIASYREALKDYHAKLPSFTDIGSVYDPERPGALRPNILYLHLFYLSALQLLHRRTLADQSPTPRTETAKLAVMEGIQAAKAMVRILSLMRNEGCIVQVCWLCIFSSYTSATVILRAVVADLLMDRSISILSAELELVESCLQMLRYCAQVDKVAADFADMISAYLTVVQSALGNVPNASSLEGTDEQADMSYLFDFSAGATAVHMAARDLFKLVQQPFSTDLELISKDRYSRPSVQASLISWAEAAVGSPYEWVWELQQSGLHAGMEEHQESIGKQCATDVLSQQWSGQFEPAVNDLPWEMSMSVIA